MAEPQGVQVPGGMGLDEHLGRGHQGTQPLPVLGVLQVEDGPSLVGVPVGEVERRPVRGERRQETGAGPSRGFDPQDVGPEVGQQAATEFAPLVGKVDDAHAIQRPLGRRHGFNHRRSPTGANTATATTRGRT